MNKGQAPKRGTMIIVAAVLLFGIAGTFWWLQSNRSSSAVVGAGGGEGWNGDHTIAVVLKAGEASQDTRITFKPASQHPAEAPIMAAVQVLVPAVDISSDHPLNVASPADAITSLDSTQPNSKVQIEFKVPKQVPLSRTDKNGKLQPSIYTASIEVFNEQYQTWVPLDTVVQGDVLVADAPHFSMYRVVQPVPGTHEVKLGKEPVAVEVQAGDDIFHLLAHAAGEWLRTLALNAFGTFAPEKMEACDKEPSKDYTVSVTAKDTSKAGACVIEQGDKNYLLIKNGWAFPMMYTTDASQGVWSETYPAELDLPAALRNKLVALFGKNVVLASGLDVGKFRITEDAPDEFNVDGSFSATGFAMDIATALFTVFMPEGYEAAAQIGDVFDLYNCIYVSAQKLYNIDLGDVPGRIAEIAKSCINPALATAFGSLELLKAFAKETRILPEIVQTGLAGVYGAATGGDSLAKVTITVSNQNKLLKWLKGKWQYDGTGSIMLLNVKDDLTGTWGDQEWDSQENVVGYAIIFHLGIDAGQPSMFIDQSNQPVVPKGTIFHIHKQSDNYIIIGDQGNFEFGR